MDILKILKKKENIKYNNNIFFNGENLEKTFKNYKIMKK